MASFGAVTLVNDHCIMQMETLFWFSRFEREWHIRSILNQRTRIDPTKILIPYFSVFSRDTPIEQVFTRPQLIVVEVLSPKDRRSRVNEKVRSYIKFGVPNIWIFDSKTRLGWDCSAGEWINKQHFEVANSPIYLSLPELLARIDEENLNKCADHIL